MKNYIEHDIRVKYIDGLLSHSQDWGWFVQCIEQDFDLEDITSWGEFRSTYSRLSDVYSSFVKISEISDVPPKPKSALLADMQKIASFFIGRLDKHECNETITTNFGHLLFFIVYITKLENSANEVNNITDFSLFIYKNYGDLIDIGTIELFEEDLNAISRMSISGWTDIEKIFRDNINKVSYEITEDFFDRFGSVLYNANAFSYQSISTIPYCTWEEQYLLNMTYTSIDKDSLKPAIVYGNNEHPNRRNWTKDVLDHMKEFFHNSQASFIIETVGYYLYRDIPSNDVILDHFYLLNEFASHSSSEEMINTSSFKMVALLFRNQDIDEQIKKDEKYKSLMKYIHNLQDPVEIERIKDAGFPVSKDQNRLLIEAAEEYFSAVNDIDDLPKFASLLQGRPDTHFLTNNQLESINNKFVDLMDTEENNIVVASVFYEYMCFLIEVNSKGVNIDKRKLHRYMINTQLLWEMEHFERQRSGMHSFSVDIPIKAESIKQFNEDVLKSPIAVANAIRMAKSEELCDVMTVISEHPLIHFITHFNIRSSFPVKINDFDYERHDVDKLLLNHVKWIIQEKGYKFLNVLDSDQYVRGILEQFRMRVDSTTALLTNEYDLYKSVENCSDIKMIEYCSELKLAHVTQLFPILEMKLRDLARNEGYFPFKKGNVEFMQYNDPSSILREIIIAACKDLHGFDPVPDLYFIYNCMYNSNALNIRNEVIHGRGFLSQNGLHYALRITLLCILMVEQRLQIIFHNRRVKLNGNTNN